MKTTLKVLALTSLLLTQFAHADDDDHSCASKTFKTYASCKVGGATVNGRRYYSVYMGYENKTGTSYHVINGANNYIYGILNRTNHTYTTVPVKLPENFGAHTKVDRSVLVMNVDGETELKWHVRGTTSQGSNDDSDDDCECDSNEDSNHDHKIEVDELPNCGPLPVELTRFEGTASAQDASKAALSWNTASEKNSDRFDVQKSEDGSNFSEIGSVKAAGNTANAHAYSFLTAKLASGMHYFRLKQIDLDGSVNFSPVRAVSTSMSATSESASVYPNPANRGDTVTVVADDTAEIMIMDSTGKTVKTLNAGNLTIDTAGLNPGLYLVKSGNKISRLEIK